MYTRPTTPQNITGVLDDGFRLYMGGLKKVLLLSFIGSVLSTLPQAAITMMGENPQIENFNATLVIIGAVIFLAVIMASMVTYAGVMLQMEAFANGRGLPLADAVMAGLGRTLPMLGAGVLLALGVMAGLILLLIPGMILMVYWALALVTVVIDRKGPVECLSYSFFLIRGSWWRTTAILTVLFLITMVMYTILMIFLVGGAIGGVSSSGEAETAFIDTVTLVVAPIFFTVLTPFGAAFLLAIRHDLKMRKEGSDLAARIDSSITD